MTILVTDGSERAALTVVRSLGRAGEEVEVCGAGAPLLAGASRYAARAHLVPDPAAAPEAFGEAILRLCRERAVEILLPISEASLLAVLPRREELGRVVVPWPDEATFRRVCDKAGVAGMAPEVGIAVPRSVRLEAPPGASSVPAATAGVGFPAVVKPARSVVEGNGRRRKVTVRHVRDRAGFARALADYPLAAYPLLVQERIVGPGSGVFLLLHEGEVRARFAHRRLREKPPSGGVSVYRESVVVEAGLVERSRDLLLRLGVRDGVAMVEYKIDADSGTPYLMEINGRFWGSLQLAVDAGVDFPRLLVASARGVPPSGLPSYREGVRLRWLMGDLDHLLAVLRNPRSVHGEGRPGRTGRPVHIRRRLPRLAALVRFLRAFGPGSRTEVLRRDDPRPFLREVRLWAAALLGSPATSSSSPAPRDSGAARPEASLGAGGRP